MRGFARVFAKDHINTDDIIPARYLVTHDESELGKHVMEGIEPRFSERIKPGDILVAGDNFGCGSSREHAVWALRAAGLRAVIASSFARIFFRNAINNGFLVLQCEGAAEKIREGDEIEIHLRRGVVVNLTRFEEYNFTAIPDFAIAMLEAGGLLPYLESKITGKKRAREPGAYQCAGRGDEQYAAGKS